MAQLKKILLVDDDDDLREVLGEQLLMTEDFDVFEAGNAHEAMIKTKDAIYDLIILDVGLPDNDGREVCRLMRKQGVKAPILMLTGHDGDADTILGLDAGANDYITKPFSPRVLLARIGAVLRRSEGDARGDSSVIEIGSVQIDTERHEVLVKGEPVALTATEFKLLSLMASKAGRVFTRQQII
ncbi:MAG: response regulator transcription factor, partial [Pseudomonadota bacterium]